MVERLDFYNEFCENYTSVMVNTSVVNDRVIDDAKKIFSLDSLVGSSKDSLIYIDIWASWCSPYRAEMPHSEKLRKEYAGKKIKFIFISTDNNYDSWIKAGKEENITSNSYLLMNVSESSFNKNFKISTIPRYLLIGKQGKVINADAPRPGDSEVRKLIDENL